MSMFGIVLVLLFVWWAAVIAYHSFKPLPPGLSMEGDVHRVDAVDFLYDLTYRSEGQIVREQMILPRILQRIEEAREWILLDMFLFNGYHDPGEPWEPVSEMLAGKLIEKKQKNPDIRIYCIVDEVNTSYGAHRNELLDTLRAHGCEVMIADVDRLRDSIPIYSSIWRMFFRWFGQKGHGWIRNPLAAHAPHVTLRSYLKLLNIKANHRKVFATEQTAILSSANPHDASAYHSNAGLEVRGAIIRDILRSEQAVVNLINGPTLPEYSVQAPETGSIQVQLLTEGAIKTHTRRAIAASQPGDVVWLAMFYLADYDILKDLVKVAERGVEVRIILDPNENAFGKGKIGIPNRPVAADLVQRSDGRIQVRWFDIWHNQFHTKLLCIQGSVLTTLIGGSANFTRRSFENHNLEANLKVVAPSTSDVAIQAIRYMERIWNNEDALFTHPYESFSDSLTPVKNVIYYLQEWLRLTTY